MAQKPARYDLVVVGASFAGLVAARTAAMRGLSVAVLDAKPDAGSRVATTGILVKEAAEELDLPHELTRRVHGVRLYAPSLKHIDLFAPGYFFLTTDTAALLRWLAREAMRGGAQLLFGTRFEGAERIGQGFKLNQHNIETRYILGADGGRSAVARHFGLGRNHQFLVGLECEYEDLDYDKRFLHCFLDSRLAPGYLAWVAPGPSADQVGLAASDHLRPDLNGFREHTEQVFGFGAGRIVERRAGRIPSGGLVDPIAAPGVMLVGDAAGMVSPMTGGGIRLAFHFGRRAGQAIGDHLLNMGPPPEAVIARELPKFGIKTALRWALDLAPPNWMYNLALGTAPMRVLAQHIYFHKRGAQGLSFAEFERQLKEMAGSKSKARQLPAQRDC